ncbi:methyltransferase family protein [Salana multivorans]|uniref:Methyltransferase family protein n=1 Tax=Salana multivorans TaxID=120377 RepID=A0A3N2D7P6_9MICO|nr:class I SAM-dependent methyltransferase [Salana multivorans]ROR95807.1 methyltransferase family protein [Salana multivorans]
MDIRAAARDRFGGRAADVMRRLNERHPWSHNEAFHAWIVTRLPDRRAEALDVGCGRGELLAVLAERFEHVRGLDVDAGMRQASRTRCAGLTNVTVDGADLAEVPAGVDLVTMVAVLHHLDLGSALEQVRRVLNPGGRFLCVGLARPESAADHAWDVASMVTNPIIGYVRHPWAAAAGSVPPPIPVRDPEVTLAEVRAVLDEAMPGARVRRHLGFRHTIDWTKPEE